MGKGWRAKLKKCTAILLVGLITYIASYCFLSLRGQYCFEQSGRLRWNYALSASDMIEWRPPCMYYHHYLDIYGKEAVREDDMGIIFSPLLRLDRRFVHKTRKVLDEEETLGRKKGQARFQCAQKTGPVPNKTGMIGQGREE